MKKLLVILTICTSAFLLVGCRSPEKVYNEPENGAKLPELPSVRKFSQAEQGEGTFSLASPSGSTEAGAVPIIYYDDEVLPTAISLVTKGLDGENLSYLYIDGRFLENLQLSDTVTELYLQELPQAIERGKHEIQLVQFAEGDVRGQVVVLKKQTYEIKVKGVV